MTLKSCRDDDKIGCAIIAAIGLGLLLVTLVATSNALGKYFENHDQMRLWFGGIVGLAFVGVYAYWKLSGRRKRTTDVPPSETPVAPLAASTRSKFIGWALDLIGIAATIALARANPTAAFTVGFALQWAGLWIVLRGQSKIVRYGGSFFVAILITVQLLLRIGAWH